MNLAAMQDSGSLNFEDAIEYIRTLEDAGEDAAAAYWHNQLKKHAGEEKPKSYRSKDNLQFQKRMDDIYGRRKNI